MSLKLFVTAIYIRAFVDVVGLQEAIVLSQFIFHKGRITDEDIMAYTGLKSAQVSVAKSRLVKQGYFTLDENDTAIFNDAVIEKALSIEP